MSQCFSLAWLSDGVTGLLIGLLEWIPPREKSIESTDTRGKSMPTSFDADARTVHHERIRSPPQLRGCAKLCPRAKGNCKNLPSFVGNLGVITRRDLLG